MKISKTHFPFVFFLFIIDYDNVQCCENCRKILWKTQLYIECDMRPWQRLNLPFIAVNNCEQVALFTLPADAEGLVLGQQI